MKKSTALKTLGLSEGASDDEVKKAHRKLIIENHPDKFGQDATARAQAEEKTKLINEARDVLLNRSWDPEYASSGTAYGAPYSYDPFAAARGTRSGASPTSGNAGYSGNPFADWPFAESFVWTTWDASGKQHTYRARTTQAGNPFEGFDPYRTQNPFDSNVQGGGNPFRGAGPFGTGFFASDFFRTPTAQEQLAEAKDDLAFDFKLIAIKAAILALSFVLSAPATGMYLYTIISIGQGIWKRFSFLSLLFVVPFVMLAIIFVPNSNTTIGIFALVFFVCAVGFDISNVVRHIKRIKALKKRTD